MYIFLLYSLKIFTAILDLQMCRALTTHFLHLSPIETM